MKGFRLSRPLTRRQRVTLGLLGVKLGLGVAVLGVAGLGWAPHAPSLTTVAKSAALTNAQAAAAEISSSSASAQSDSAFAYSAHHHGRPAVFTSGAPAASQSTSTGSAGATSTSATQVHLADFTSSRLDSADAPSASLEYAVRTSRTRGQPVSA